MPSPRNTSPRFPVIFRLGGILGGAGPAAGRGGGGKPPLSAVNRLTPPGIVPKRRASTSGAPVWGGLLCILDKDSDHVARLRT